MDEFKNMVYGFMRSNLDRKDKKGGCLIGKVPCDEVNYFISASDAILLCGKYEKTEEELREVIFGILSESFIKQYKED